MKFSEMRKTLKKLESLYGNGRRKKKPLDKIGEKKEEELIKLLERPDEPIEFKELRRRLKER